MLEERLDCKNECVKDCKKLCINYDPVEYKEPNKDQYQDEMHTKQTRNHVL